MCIHQLQQWVVSMFYMVFFVLGVLAGLFIAWRFRRMGKRVEVVICPECRASVFRELSTGKLFDAFGPEGCIIHQCMKQRCFKVRKRGTR